MITEDASVIVKLRGFTSSELEKEVQSCWEVPGPTSILDSEQNKLYLFDRVYAGSSTAQSIYEESLENIIWRAVEGFSSCICTMGQSGSGKSYLMHGTGNLDFSLVKLTVSTLFAYIAASPGSEYLIRCSLFEISHNFVFDLFQETRPPVLVDFNENCFVFKEEFLTSVTQACNLLTLGLENKGAGHVIVRIILEQRNKNTKDACRAGIISLVDISAKEKGVNVDGVLRNAFEKFFFEKRSDGFSQVVMKYSEKSFESLYKAPKSNLKITQYFENLLSGNSKIIFICCLSPGTNFYDQSVESLLLAKKAKKIKVKISKNSIPSNKFKMFHLDVEKKSLISQSQDLERKINEYMQKTQRNQAELSQDDSTLQEIEKMLNDKIALTRKIEQINRFFLVIDSIPSGFPLAKPDTMSLERRMLRYSLSRTSSEFKDDGFLMNIIRANKNTQAMNKLNQKIDLLTELSFNSDIKTLDVGKVRQELESLNQQYEYRDSLLIEKIDNINQLFESFDPKESLNLADGNLIRDSLAYLNTAEVAKDENDPNIQKMLVLIEEQDKIIDSLQFKLLDKDDKLDLLQDELDLCRKNIMNMQKQLRDFKKNK